MFRTLVCAVVALLLFVGAGMAAKGEKGKKGGKGAHGKFVSYKDGKLTLSTKDGEKTFDVKDAEILDASAGGKPVKADAEALSKVEKDKNVRVHLSEDGKVTRVVFGVKGGKGKGKGKKKE